MKNQGKSIEVQAAKKPAQIKKTNIISIKRRDAVSNSNMTNDSQHMSSSKGLPAKNQGPAIISGQSKRAPSLDPDVSINSKK